MGKVLRFRMPDPCAYPADRTTERTGVYRCTHCLQPVEPVEYFRNDQVCDKCVPTNLLPLAGGNADGHRPVDEPEVRAKIEQRGQ